MAVAYLAKNSGFTAAELNALTAELDGILNALYAGKSWLIYYRSGATMPEGKRFYFGTKASRLVLPAIGVTADSYNHSDYTTYASGLTIDAYDHPNHIAINYCGGTWDLDDSLEAHTVDVAGTPYFWYGYVAAGTPYSRERYRKLHVAEIICEATGGTLTWDSSWNKYHFLRFHNLDQSPLLVNLPGGSSITIPRFGVQAVRRGYPNLNTWDSTYTYLWKAQSGDSLCWDSDPQGANNVGSMQCFHRWMDAILTLSPNRKGVFGRLDIWDGSSLLESVVDGATPLYQLMYHTGEMREWENASVAPSYSTESPNWTSLLAGTGVVKLVDDSGTMKMEEDSGATTPVDVLGVSTNLFPAYPVTLPYYPPSSFNSVSATGAYTATNTLSAVYYTDPARTPPYRVEVTQDYDQTIYGTTWTDGATSVFSDLDTLGTLTSSSADEATATPTVAWSSNGWNLYGYGTVSFPLSLGVIPDNVENIDVDYNAGFSEWFGVDALARSTWNYRQRRTGRRISAYVGVTSAGIVYYDGHPDVTGTYGLLDGLDWEESRGTPDAAVILKDEVNAESAAQTQTLPVYPRADSAERIVALGSDTASYLAGRTNFLAVTTTNADQQGLVRLPITREHYNHISQRLNSIWSIAYFTLDDVIYYGLDDLNDGAWPYAWNIANMYCAVAAAGSRAAALSLTISGSGAASYLSLATAKGWATALGFRFDVRRICGVRKNSDGGHTRDTTETGRIYYTAPFWIAQRVYMTSWGDLPPPSAGADVEQLGIIEKSQDLGTVPAAWTAANDSGMLVVPRPILNYTSDPMAYTTDLDLEVIDVFTAQAVDNALVAESYIPAPFDSQDIADFFTLGTIDPHSAWEVSLLNRQIFVRA